MTSETKGKILDLEHEFKIACKVGYVLSTTPLKAPRRLEIKLPATVDAYRARLITEYIRKKYGFSAHFYAKKHNINVFYDERC